MTRQHVNRGFQERMHLGVTSLAWQPERRTVMASVSLQVSHHDFAWLASTLLQLQRLQTELWTGGTLDWASDRQ